MSPEICKKLTITSVVVTIDNDIILTYKLNNVKSYCYRCIIDSLSFLIYNIY